MIVGLAAVVFQGSWALLYSGTGLLACSPACCCLAPEVREAGSISESDGGVAVACQRATFKGSDDDDDDADYNDDDHCLVSSGSVVSCVAAAAIGP